MLNVAFFLVLKVRGRTKAGHDTLNVNFSNSSHSGASRFSAAYNSCRHRSACGRSTPHDRREGHNSSGSTAPSGAEVTLRAMDGFEGLSVGLDTFKCIQEQNR